MNEDNRTHLEFIQQTITRMNTNAFQLKGWSAALVTALFVLAVKDTNPKFVLLALLSTLVFWLFDAYFLMQERWYRSLFDFLRTKDDTQIARLNHQFSMNPTDFHVAREPLLKVAARPTVAGFYLILLAAAAIAYCLVR